MYRSTTRRWSSSWTGKALNLPGITPVQDIVAEPSGGSTGGAWHGDVPEESRKRDHGRQVIYATQTTKKITSVPNGIYLQVRQGHVERMNLSVIRFREPDGRQEENG